MPPYVVNLQAIKLDNLKNRLYRNNICFVRIPEKAQGNNPVQFKESWLLNTFGKETLLPQCVVERAYWVSISSPTTGQSPKRIPNQATQIQGL